MMPMNPKLLQAVVLAAMFGGEPPVRKDTPVADENEDFHAHLKRCKQCADHPFALCVTGERLIKLAAEAAPTPMWASPPCRSSITNPTTPTTPCS